MSEQPCRLITFSLAGKRHALRLAQTAEVLEDVPTFPVPRTPSFLGEVINCHGRIVPVLELAALMGCGSATDDAMILVLDQHVADLALRVGGAVAIVPPEAATDEMEGDGALVERYVTVAGERVALLSPGRIVELLETALRD